MEIWRRFFCGRIKALVTLKMFGSDKEDNDMNLKGRNFLTLKDFTKEEILYLLDLAADFKETKKNQYQNQMRF